MFTILYNDEQMVDIKSLCYSGRTKLGVDKTFNMCDMHVTGTCFKQLSVSKILLDDSPLFIGPVFLTIILILKVTVSFYHLKIKLVDTDLSKLVIGTDEEATMVKLFSLLAYYQYNELLFTLTKPRLFLIWYNIY